MSYQTYHPVTGTTVVPIGRHSESGQSSSETTENESSPLYPFGKPVFLSSIPTQMGIVNSAFFAWAFLILKIINSFYYSIRS